MALDSPQLGANLATPTLGMVSTLTCYVCWRCCETARARKTTKGGRAGSSSLPSPVAVLPRWLPFLGGHTLQMETEKLNQQEKVGQMNSGATMSLPSRAIGLSSSRMLKTPIAFCFSARLVSGGDRRRPKYRGWQRGWGRFLLCFSTRERGGDAREGSCPLH